LAADGVQQARFRSTRSDAVVGDFDFVHLRLLPRTSAQLAAAGAVSLPTLGTGSMPQSGQTGGAIKVQKVVHNRSRVTPGRRTRERILDSRHYQRVNVLLHGHYLLEDQREFECCTLDMSPGGIALDAQAAPAKGEHVVVYLNCIGRIDGVCVRDIAHGFAMTINATPRRREKLAEQLTWLANQKMLGLADLRSSGRIVPRQVQTTLSLENGTNMPARIVDLSRSGVALVIGCVPCIGSVVFVGKMKGHVVRTLDQGIAVEFTRMIPFQMFDENIEL
jgi:hypothetical protein